MKLPFPQDDHNKRMATTPDSPVSRSISYELRETSLLNGVNNNINAPRLMIDKAVQFDPDMEMNNDLNGVASFTPLSHESEIRPEWSSTANETIPVHAKVTSTDDTIKVWRREVENDVQQKPPPLQQQQPLQDDGPRYKINQSDDTPDGDSQTNTSTWRVRDRQRNNSGSDDEIEKVAEFALDVLDGEKGKNRGDSASNQDTEPVGASIKPDDRPRNDDDDSDCVVQCLAYTLQCCECVIS